MLCGPPALSLTARLLCGPPALSLTARMLRCSRAQGPDALGGFVDVEVSGIKRGHIPVRQA